MSLGMFPGTLNIRGCPFQSSRKEKKSRHPINMSMSRFLGCSKFMIQIVHGLVSNVSKMFEFLICALGHWIGKFLAIHVQIPKFMIFMCGCASSHQTNNESTTMSYSSKLRGKINLSKTCNKSSANNNSSNWTCNKSWAKQLK